MLIVGSTSFGTIQVVIPLNLSTFYLLVVSTQEKLYHLDPISIVIFNKEPDPLLIGPPIGFDLVLTDSEFPNNLHVHEGIH